MPLAEIGDWIWVNIDIVLVSSVVSSVIIRLNPPKRWMGTVMFVAYVLYIVAIFSHEHLAYWLYVSLSLHLNSLTQLLGCLTAIDNGRKQESIVSPCHHKSGV